MFINSRIINFILIVISGEIIFSLPFHTTRFFRPQFLEFFNLSNSDLGDIFAYYGLTSMLAYGPGGVIADRFSAKNLMALALALTALGGYYLLSSPSVLMIKLLYAYWGVTTILIFWASMIKLTRVQGGDKRQGLAFGLLDGGRGLVASLLVSALFTFLPVFSSSINISDELSITQVIFYYSTLTLFIAVMIYFFYFESKQEVQQQETKDKIHWELVKDPKVILLSLIILSAYCCYKAVDNYGLFLVSVFNFDDAKASELIGQLSYSRFFAAIIAGIIADRFRASKVITLTFVLATATYLMLAYLGESNPYLLLLSGFLLTCIFVFALRGIYFALIDESKQGLGVTGTIVGLVSFIGYTPDLFFGSLSGRLLDSYNAVNGYQNYFILLGIIAFIGAISSYLFTRNFKRAQ